MEEKDKEMLANTRLIDDPIFEQFFKEDPKYIEIVINEIFKQKNQPLVRVKEVSTQEIIYTNDNRWITIDAVAVDENGQKVNIEVLRPTPRSLAWQVRYHIALLDSTAVSKGEYFDATYLIYITEKDIRGLGLPAYHVENCFAHDKSPCGDGLHIIFVNGEYRGSDPIGNLMNDFFCTGADEMKNPELAKRMHYLKETEEGQSELFSLEEKIEAKGKRKVAINLIKMGRNSLEEIFRATGISLEELVKIKAELKPS